MNPPKPFTELPISTQTVMAYCNCTFNPEYIYDNLQVDLETDTPKQGGIYQVKGAGKSKGIPTNRGHFRNQITVRIWAINKIITIKIFRTGKFHLTGCKTKEHIYSATTYLLNHIRKLGEEACQMEPNVETSSQHSAMPPPVEETPKEKTAKEKTPKDSLETVKGSATPNPLRAIFEIVMVNVDFKLGFKVDQEALDSLVQKNGGEDFYSTYETTLNTSVNIKMEYPEPEVKQFTQLSVHPTKPEYTLSTINECPKARERKTRTHTFLVFSSSKVIQSGRYYESQMEPAYKRFNTFIQTNKEAIKMKSITQKFDLNSLSSIST